VLYGQQGKQYIVVDPALGVRRLSATELAEGWIDWVLLLLEPDPNRFGQEVHDTTDRPQQGFGRFFQRILAYKGILGQAALLNVFVGLLSLAAPILLQILTDDVLIRGDLKLLHTVAIAVILMTVVSNILEWIQANLIAHFAQRLELGLILEFCKRLLYLPLSYYEARRSGEIVSRLQDIQQLNQLVSQIIVTLPSQAFVAILSAVLMLFYSWKLSVLALIIAISMTFCAIVLQPMLRRKTQALLVADSESQGVLVETFKGALAFKTMTAAPQFWQEFQRRYSHLGNLSLRTNQIGILNSSFAGMVSGVGSIALLWFGGNLVIDPAEQLSVGQLLAFKAMNDNFLYFINSIINFVDEFTRMRAAMQRLTEITHAVPEEQEDAKRPAAEIAPDAEITCDNIDFSYSNRDNLLSNFSVKIPGGQAVAILGQSGCGKSTLAKLLTGFYPVQAGNIRFGLYNQQDLSLESLRRQVVLVPQDPHFWNRSILENFRLADPNLSFEQIVTACQIAGADEFISQFPNKYQTILGEFATNLSGGQRQRLAIARALVTDPPILILDESTSGLDAASETTVFDRLLQHRQGKTTLLISHRPSVINRADWILLLDKGQVKVQGPQKEILAQVNHQIDALYGDNLQAIEC
jgi:ATP-binding cassette, subfamily C, bacterial